MLISSFLSSFIYFCSAVSEEKSKMSQPIRGQGAILFFFIGTKNTNLVEDVEILLPVKFYWIPFSIFRGEVENVSANQRPGLQSCFSDPPEKHKLSRGHWDLAACQVLLSSVLRFQKRSGKYDKLTMTDDGRRTKHDHNSALEPSVQGHLKRSNNQKPRWPSLLMDRSKIKICLRNYDDLLNQQAFSTIALKSMKIAWKCSKMTNSQKFVNNMTSEWIETCPKRDI